MPDTPHTVFASHAYADNALCDRYVDALRKRGLDVWYDRANTQSGQLIREEIETQLRRRSALVVLLTPASVASEWVRMETSAFLDLAANDTGRLLLPVRLAECEIPPLMRNLYWIDAVSLGFDSAIDKLARALHAPGTLPSTSAGTEQSSAATTLAEPMPERDEEDGQALLSRPEGEEKRARGITLPAEPDAAAPVTPASEQDGEEVVRGITLPDKPKPDISPPVDSAPEQERAGEAVTGGWDTPTMRLPGREEAPPAPSPAPMPAPPAMSPPPPPAPIPPQAPMPPGAPIASPPPPAPVPMPPGAPPPPSAPMPAPWGQPPAGQPAYPPQPMYPPRPAPGYAPPPQAYPPPAGAGYGAPPAPPYPPMPQMAPAQQPGGYGYPGPYPGQGAPQPGMPVAPVAVAEQVTFTAYHLREIAPLAWEPLYVYIALDTPQAQAQVGVAAQQALAGRADQFRPARAAQSSWLRRGTQLSLVPSVPGFQFNPPEMIVTWEEDVQQHLFRMQAATARPGFAVNGSIQVFTGPLLRADIPISLFVRQAGMGMPMSQSFASTAVRAYRKVFASYSHKDTAVVESCETAAEVTGDRYLRDVTLLRSGEQWDPRLLQAIGEADLFQLFWSEHAARSQAVATEWRHALSLQPGRGNFIRPVYWSKQPYAIPPELGAIHFERLSLARLGWGKARIFIHNVIGRG